MELNLGQSYNLTTVEAKKVNTSTVDVDYTVDNGISVQALVRFPDGNAKSLTLWDADTTPDYDTIGDWTEEEKNERIIELLTA